jgi:hypothetical protein
MNCFYWHRKIPLIRLVRGRTGARLWDIPDYQTVPTQQYVLTGKFYNNNNNNIFIIIIIIIIIIITAIG